MEITVLCGNHDSRLKMPNAKQKLRGKFWNNMQKFSGSTYSNGVESDHKAAGQVMLSNSFY
jgi:hypothetical protein